jgi:hypothetical protein
MNGVFRKEARWAGLPKHSSFVRPDLGSLAVPALAIGGLIGVVGVLVGLQCGGLDKCFFRPAPEAIAVVEPAVAAEPVAAEQRLTPDPVVVAEPVPTPEEQQAAQIASLIGGSFAAVNANDECWLQSARAATATLDTAPMVEEGDGAGPIAVASTSPAWTGETAATAAIDAAAIPVMPLDRPEPLEVSAYANTRSTPPAVSAAAQDQLDAVAEAAAPEPAPEPVEVATVEEPDAAGDIRTITGSGVTVRSGPGRSNGRLFALSAGEKVTVLANQNGWLQIRDDQNRTGWAYQSFMR